MTKELKKVIIMIVATVILSLIVEYGDSFEGVVIGALCYIAIFKN